MHYIRLLRPPSLDEKDHLKLVLTITTDLGDSFLCPEQPLPISVYAHHLKQHLPHQAADNVRIDDGSVSWRSGLRVLKLDLQLPAQFMRTLRNTEDDKNSPSIRIIASRKYLDPPNIAEIPFDTEGRVLGLSVSLPRPGRATSFTASRELSTSGKGIFGTLRIDEEIGESIDRHVWDAGVVTTGLFFDMCKTGHEAKWAKTRLLRKILCSATSDRPLNVIELGCGVGILGVGLATVMSAQYRSKTLDRSSQEGGHTIVGSGNLESCPADADPEPSQLGSILLTDLPDAEELTTGNILQYNEAQYAASFGSVPLEFESLDWEDGKNGMFGPRAYATAWDLIIISDCTYNVDMLSALVDTLSALYKTTVGLGKTGPNVMLATKPRHSSEKALFDLMTASGWNILESASQLLPSLGLEDESVEIYLFGKMTEQESDTRQPPSAKRRRLV